MFRKIKTFKTWFLVYFSGEGRVKMTFLECLDSESIGDDQKVRRRHVEVEDRNLNPQTWGEMLKAWPKTTLCIVSNEFCERFSYYGMRSGS